MHRDDIFSALGLSDTNSGVYAGGWLDGSRGDLVSENAATTEPIDTVAKASGEQYDAVVTRAEQTFAEWRMVPAPVRGAR